MNLLQTIPDTTKITPFEGYAVYSFVVLLLITAVYTLWKETKAKEKEYKELSERTIILMTKVADKIDGFDDLKGTLGENRHLMQDNKALLVEIKGILITLKK